MTDFIDQNFPREVEFLKKLVRVPSDNPPGDCARHADVAAKELEQLGFTVERHRVPDAVVKKHGMASRNTIADALNLERSLTYLSLLRLRKAGVAKRCVSEATNELLWTVDKDKPCP
jgi:acetylornithine deacetylase/succinyl-diaminopimelate desuccinylase-like protein